MDHELYIIQKTMEMTADFTCSREVKNAAKGWMDARGTGEEAARWENYLTVLADCIQPIDRVLEFSGSAAAAKTFGSAEYAHGLHAHYLESKAAGAKYCDCPACTAAMKILEAAGRPVR